MKKLFIAFLFILLAMPFASAIVNLDIPLPTSLGNSYGTFKFGSDIILLQTCTNETAFCDFCNLTSLKFDGDVLVVANEAMEKNTALFNYTLDGSYTAKIGHYTVTGFCVAGGVYSPFAYTFEITKSGEILTNMNFLPIVIILIFFIGMLLFIANSLAEEHSIITIFFIILSLFLSVPLVGIANILIENNFIDSGLLGQMEVFLTIIPWIIFCVIFYIVVYIFIKALESWKKKKLGDLGLEGFR